MKRWVLILFLAFIPALALAVGADEYYAAGIALFNQHDYEKALPYFRAAVDQKPDFWQAYQFLGEAYFQAANRTEAVLAMRQSLKLHPNNPDLVKFVEKVEKDSPWVSPNTFRGTLPVISLLISLLSLALTVWLNRRPKSS